jgi:hypothetical protein
LSQSVKHAKINHGQYAGVIQLGISFAASRAGRFVHNAQRPLPTRKGAASMKPRISVVPVIAMMAAAALAG